MTVLALVRWLWVCAFVSFTLIVGIIWLVDPDAVGVLAVVFLYLSVFIASFSVCGALLCRALASRCDQTPRALGKSMRIGLRQATLLAFLTVGLLGLAQMRALVWWTAAILVCGILLVEWRALHSDKSGYV